MKYQITARILNARTGTVESYTANERDYTMAWVVIARKLESLRYSESLLSVTSTASTDRIDVAANQNGWNQ